MKPDHKGRNTLRSHFNLRNPPIAFPSPLLLSFLPFSVPFPRSAVTRFIKIKGIHSAKSPGSNGSAGQARRQKRREPFDGALHVLLLTNREDSHPASAPGGTEGKALGRITRAKRFCRRQRHGVPISLAAQIRRTFLLFVFERRDSQEERKSNLRASEYGEHVRGFEGGGQSSQTFSNSKF